MKQTMQEQFEQAFSEDNSGVPVTFVKLQRQGDSYSEPRTARAWYWFKRSRETLVVDLPTVDPEPEPPEDAIDDSWLDAHHAAIRMRNACFKAIDAAGVKVGHE
ncbi:MULTISPECIES: hypothetical protein [unclassified Pseudomonas]|uniref:hypothetical protein n=1 Tax=unclassified Pseudomonas TaxID=196821 RepID=UPI0012FDA715|nr:MULTISPECIES: hypothetical protein [unclassified Pseudomonas]MCU1736344.1 hypothetical protein [Pseudomonas sp. 20S_6.2_Bac1]